MSLTARLDVQDHQLLPALRTFFKAVLADDEVSAIFLPRRLPMQDTVMPALVSDPALLDEANPLAPAFPLNSARLVARLTRGEPQSRVVAVLRPCEIRAFIELVKLHQGRTESVLTIGIDCLGAFQNTAFAQYAAGDPDESAERFCRQRLSDPSDAALDAQLAPACRACEHPVAEEADLVIGLFGINADDHLPVSAQSDAGEALLERLGLPETVVSPEREQVVAAVKAGRIDFRDRMFAETREATGSLEKLNQYLAGCVNCYNCRVACPVCYCRECVFNSDQFDHEPVRYLRWAARKGAIKMPTDTVFYHLTRLAHMSTACVGCGQCSNACPNDIPVMELFRTVAHRTQNAFGYAAGHQVDQPPPLTVFREDEFQEVVGL